MALRGQTLSVLLNPTVAGELDDFEKFAPVQTEMTNGVRTLAGAWTRRPGYAEWKGTQILNGNSTIIGLHDTDDHILAVSENGVILSIADTSFGLGQWDQDLGVIDVNSRPYFADFGGIVAIASGGAPKMIYKGNLTRLGLEIEAPTESPIISQTEGEGSHGRSGGYWVFGLSYVTINGETQVGPESDPVFIATPYEAARIIIPATDIEFVNRRRLYAARYAGGARASVWRLVKEIEGRGAVEVVDALPDSRMGETEISGNTAQSLAPFGARYIVSLSDHVVVAGYDPYDFAFSSTRTLLSWPLENTRRVDTEGGPITGLGALGSTLLVFCRNSTEIWGVTGGNLPFTRRQKINIGCCAPDSIVRVKNFYYMVGDDREVYAVTPGEMKPISLGNRDWFLSVQVPANIYAIHFPYERRVRYFSREKKTVLVYDYANNCFSEEAATDSRGEQRMVPLIAGTTYRNRMIVARRNSGDLYEWSFDHETDLGEKILVTRRLRVPLSQFGYRGRVLRIRIRLKRTSHAKLEIARPPFITVSWGFDEATCQNTEDLFLLEDGDGPYVDICAPGTGRELELQIVEGDDVPYMVTHAYVTVLDLGR